MVTSACVPTQQNQAVCLKRSGLRFRPPSVGRTADRQMSTGAVLMLVLGALIIYRELGAE